MPPHKTGTDGLVFTLVLATLGRTEEIERFLDSLVRQQYRSVEVLVVDQNRDNRLMGILERFGKTLSLTRLHSEPGLSRARNVALAVATGDIVAFPDDDCWYPDELLIRVARFFREHPDVDGLSGRVAHQEQGPSYARFDRSAGFVTLRNVWQRVSSVSFFLRRGVITAVGGFDEQLGIGAGTPWGGGEDIDYPLRALKEGYTIHYDPSIVAMHPSPFRLGYDQASVRAFRYGAGIGRVWRKHSFPKWLVAYYLMRPLGGSVLSFLMARPSRARYYLWAFRGRVLGWLSA